MQYLHVCLLACGPTGCLFAVADGKCEPKTTGPKSWGARSRAPIANAEEDILAQERLGLDRWSAGDPVGYAHSAAVDVTYCDDIGAASRIDGVEAWRSYLSALEVPPHQFEIIDPKVQVYGDIGILTLHYHGVGPDGEVLSRWKASSIYRYEAGEWHTVHAHWSVIKEE